MRKKILGSMATVALGAGVALLCSVMPDCQPRFAALQALQRPGRPGTVKLTKIGMKPGLSSMYTVIVCYENSGFHRA